MRSNSGTIENICSRSARSSSSSMNAEISSRSPASTSASARCAAAEQYMPSGGAPALDGEAELLGSRVPMPLSQCNDFLRSLAPGMEILQRVPLGGVDEFRCQSLGHVQVRHLQSESTSSEGERGAQRLRVLQAPGFLDGLSEGPHRALGVALKPVDAGQKVASHDAQIQAGALNEKAPWNDGQLLQQAFEAPARELVLASPVQRNAEHQLCRHRRDGISQRGGDRVGSMSKRDRGPYLAHTHVVNP